MEVKNIVIVNKENFEKKKQTFLEEGKEKIHVLTDFDKTLTKAQVNGKSFSAISILRNGDYISKEYAEKAHALADHYRPIEKDLSIPVEERKKKMNEWWTKHFDLLIESGLNKKHLEQIIQGKNIQFRKGALEMIDFLHEKKIPLVIMSSSGVGDAISMFLKKEGKLYDNINVISNSYKWDKNGNAIGVKKPIIHSMSKSETAIQNYPVFSIIKDRKNVVLLGDDVSDVGMIDGFDYNNLIKIGFLNKEVEKNLEFYKSNYDVLLLNDVNMIYVNNLIKEIVK